VTQDVLTPTPAGLSEPPRAASTLRTEDWWANLIGVGLVLIATILFETVHGFGWIAVTPAKWSQLSDIGGHFAAHWIQYVALYLLFAALFGAGVATLGIRLADFLRSFTLVYLVAVVVFTLGQWERASYYNLEPPLVALLLGLVISNFVGLPAWMDSGFRVEFYVKTGIVLLGATLPFNLIGWAGPVAILQAGIVSIVTFSVIFWVGTRLKLDPRLCAVLGAGGAVCGVSGAIAIAGAVGAKREHAPIAITLVILWAIVMIFLLPLVSRELALPTGVAGAWIGTSEFADAAGLAAAQTYSGYAGHVPNISGTPEAALSAFTLMKVIGRDAWIGIWAFVLAIVASTRWQDEGVRTSVDAAQIWARFPKFVIGFLVASAIVSLVSSGVALADFNKTINPELVAPLKNLRTWAFIFCFFSIGLTTRFKQLAGATGKPFYAFSAGVAVNVALGFVLSTQVFADHWVALSH
jgi:uncharacterized integral membrane protein (TIGR00698 family)